MSIEQYIQESAQECLLNFNRVISDTVCEVVDDHIIPELVENTERERVAGTATTLLRDAAAILAKEVPVDEAHFLMRLVARFQQHIDGECADDSETSEIMRWLRVLQTGAWEYMIVPA